MCWKFQQGIHVEQQMPSNIQKSVAGESFLDFLKSTWDSLKRFRRLFKPIFGGKYYTYWWKSYIYSPPPLQLCYCLPVCLPASKSKWWSKLKILENLLFLQPRSTSHPYSLAQFHRSFTNEPFSTSMCFSVSLSVCFLSHFSHKIHYNFCFIQKRKMTMMSEQMSK